MSKINKQNKEKVSKTSSSSKVLQKSSAPNLQYLHYKKESKNIIIPVAFGKYSAAGVTRKEALVNGQCLRIHTERITNNELKSIVERQNCKTKTELQLNLKETTTAKNTKSLGKLKNKRINQLKSERKKRILNLQFKRNLLPLHLIVKNRNRTPNRKFNNFITSEKKLSVKPKILKKTKNMNKTKSEVDVIVKHHEVSVDEPCQEEEEVTCFLPISGLDEPLTNIPEKDSDPLSFESDPLSIDSELPNNILENSHTEKETTDHNDKLNNKKVNEQTPLRTYGGKRTKKPTITHEVEEKKLKLDESTVNLEALLLGKQNKNEDEAKEEKLKKDNKIEEKLKKDNKIEEKSDVKKEILKFNGDIFDESIIYTLVFNIKTKVGRKRLYKNNLGFERLVQQLKLIRLPGSNWKIKIFVTRDQQISEITFTDKKPNERCVKFTRNSCSYLISFNSRQVTLIGAPSAIDCYTDISHLLEIVNGLDENDPVIEYGTYLQ